MNSWKVILATLVIFITGVVTGGLLVSYADRASQKPRFVRPREGIRPQANFPNPAAAANPREPVRLPNPLLNRMQHGLSMEFLQKLDAEVRLTPDQRERIQQIISDGQARNKEIWEGVAPELRHEMAETQRQIRDVLTPDQRARFEELMKQSRPALRRANDEPLTPGTRPRDPRRPLPPRDAQDAAQPAPQQNP